MTELNMRHKELQDSLAEIRTELDKVSTIKKPAEKTKMLNDLEDKVSRARRDMKMVEMEVRVLDPDARNIWKGRLKGELTALKDITRDMEWARTSEGVQPADKPIDPSQMTEANLMDYGNKLMNETNESAETAIRILNETQEVGIETAAKLKAQTEQLNRIHDQAYEIDDTLTRATFIVKRMLRRTATDKYIWCMALSILILIIFIIVYKILRGDNVKVSTNDQWHH